MNNKKSTPKKDNPNNCSVCGKCETVGYNKPHSLHRTKRTVKPNVQKNMGKLICTRCLRTKNKKN